VGNIADIVVFDPETIADRSTMEDPYQYAVGVKSLLVNGILTIENGVYNGKRPGVIYRKPHSWLPW
jgi:N-acyl-D-aspartate/D-glutamate deacylase